MIRAVLFDVGGVLTPPLLSIVAGPVLASGVDVQALQSVLLPMFSSDDDTDAPGHRWERGEIGLDAFCALMGDLGAAVRTVMDPGSPHYLGQDFCDDPRMTAFVGEVRAAGFRTGIVSNTVHEWLPAWSQAVRPELFDTVLYSCEVGLRKPDPAIYLLAAERLGVAPDELLFLDDFAPMTAAARPLGIRTVDVTDHDTAIAEARAVLGLPTPAATGS